MNTQNPILIELKALSPLLAGMEKINPYQVPAGYFEQLRDHILDKTIYLPSFSLDKTQNQQVPVGYFNSLASNILAKIKTVAGADGPLRRIHADNLPNFESAADELRQLSPMLYSIQGEQTYEVPHGYFNSLSEVIVARAVPAEEAKVISFRKKSVWRYAAAAVMTGVIAASSMWMMNRNQVEDAGTMLAETKITSKLIEDAGKINTEAEINQQIASLPVEDIVTYLEKTSSAADLELLAGSIDESELPEQADYLLDENALNDYLKKIDSDLKTN